VLPARLVSAPRHAAPLTHTSACTPAAATGPRCRPARPVSRAVPPHVCCRPPLFTARARDACAARHCQSSRVRAVLAHVTDPPSDRAGPLLRFSPPHGAKPRTPLPLPSPPVPPSHHKKVSATVLLPFRPAPSYPHSSTLPPPPSFLESTRRPRTPGPSLPSPISFKTPPPSARLVSR
jgi:hypothetical protein